MKVKFLSAVNHDGKSFAEGDGADLPNSAARELIACGAAEQFDPAAAKAAAKVDADAEAARIAAELAAKAQA